MRDCLSILIDYEDYRQAASSNSRSLFGEIAARL